MLSAAEAVSKPLAVSSSGSKSCNGVVMPSKSRTVFSYSSRFRRRMRVRPSPRRAFASAASATFVQFSVLVSAASGGLEFYGGGISPASSLLRQPAW